MGVALVTPFNEDGSVDYDSLLRLVEYQIQNGTDFLCVLGTTAETPTLTSEEKQKIKKVVIERVNERVPILLGVSSNCTQTVVDTLKNDDMTGVDAVLVAVPYYNKPSQEGIYQHYKAIAQATDLPVVLYNVPGRTGVNMTAETTLRLARDFENIVAIKEASGNITQMDDIIKNKPANFDVISGDDGITFPLITLGAVGVISVIGNAFPREFSRMVRLALAGDYSSALAIHHQFTELFKLLFVDGNPAGVKAMLNMMGMIKNRLRLPLVPTRITTFEEMRRILNELCKLRIASCNSAFRPSCLYCSIIRFCSSINLSHPDRHLVASFWYMFATCFPRLRLPVCTARYVMPSSSLSSSMKWFPPPNEPIDKFRRFASFNSR